MPDIMPRHYRVIVMSKIWYKLIFQQITPLHVGKFNYGVLSETSVFIPGWTMWGALVNKYGWLKGGHNEKFEEGKDLFKNITCFYPSLLNGKSEYITLFPIYEDGFYYLGDYREDKFRAKFTDVYMSTSIRSDTLAAKDESLHEIEVLLPGEKGDSSKRLYWTGLLGSEREKTDIIEQFLRKSLRIIVGGDSRYGLGDLELIDVKKAEKLDFQNWHMDEEGFPDCKRLRNYFVYDQKGKHFVITKGKIERIITEFDFTQLNRKIVESNIAIAPGGKLEINNKNDLEIQLAKGVFCLK